MHEAATRAATQDADRLRQEQGQLQQRIMNDAETAAKAAQAQAQQQNAKVAMLNVKLNAATTTCHGKETALAEARVQLDLVSKKAQQLEQGLAGEKKKSHSLQQEFDTFKSMHDSISQAKASEAEQSLRKQLEDLTVVRDELGKLNQVQKDALVSSLWVAVDGLIVPARYHLVELSCDFKGVFQWMALIYLFTPTVVVERAHQVRLIVQLNNPTLLSVCRRRK